MVSAIKLIFRLDFPVNHSFMDKPGTALALFGDMSGKAWKKVGEGEITRSFVGEHKDEGLFRTFSMEPRSLNGQISISGGVDINQVHSDENFRLIGKIINEFMKEFQIKELTRCGIRYLCLEKVGGDTAQKLSRTSKIIHGEVWKAVLSELGVPDDCGVTFEGQSDAGTKFRTIFGPFFEKDIDNHLGHLALKAAEKDYLLENDLICDIDLWENDFTFAASSFYRWSEGKQATASSFIQSIVALIHKLDA